jgi:hypothetical protein
LLDELLRETPDFEVIAGRIKLVFHQYRLPNFEFGFYAFDNLQSLFHIIETEVHNLIRAGDEAEDTVTVDGQQIANFSLLLIGTGEVFDDLFVEHIEYFYATILQATKCVLTHHYHIFDR